MNSNKEIIRFAIQYMLDKEIRGYDRKRIDRYLRNHGIKIKW